MQKQIVVPLDGSRLAEKAIPHAVAMARATGSELTLLQVVSITQSPNPLAWGVPVVSPASTFRDQMMESAREYLRDVTVRLGSESMSVQVEALEGDAAEAIIVYAEQHPDVVMIVMATRGRSGLSRWVLGSVAEKVLQAAPVPLALIRSQVDPGDRAEPDSSAFGRRGLPAIPSYRTIAVPLDFSLLAEEALAQAAALASATGASLLLVSVMPLPYPIDLPVPARAADYEDTNSVEADTLWPPRQSIDKALQEVKEQEKLAMAGYLASVARRIVEAEKAAGYQITVDTRVLEGDPAKEILLASSEGGADLIVMSTRGRGGLARLWAGSVAMNVVREAALPVLLVRERVARQPEQP